ANYRDRVDEILGLIWPKLGLARRRMWNLPERDHRLGHQRGNQHFERSGRHRIIFAIAWLACRITRLGTRPSRRWLFSSRLFCRYLRLPILVDDQLLFFRHRRKAADFVRLGLTNWRHTAGSFCFAAFVLLGRWRRRSPRAAAQVMGHRRPNEAG